LRFSAIWRAPARRRHAKPNAASERALTTTPVGDEHERDTAYGLTRFLPVDGDDVLPLPALVHPRSRTPGGAAGGPTLVVPT